ncbi:MAG: hypothetical protein U1F43_30940 [Myxococcota bacterium]
MTLAHDADPAAAWSAIIARLGALAPAPLPADLITPAAWITVAVGAAGKDAPGPELSRDNASCRR